MSKIQKLDEDFDLDMYIRRRNLRDIVGKALGKAYPTHPWYVEISNDGTVAQVTSPAISNEFGMVIHLNVPRVTIEQKAVKMGGELLERFNVSRTVADFSGIDRRIDGNAMLGKAGGV